MENKALDLVVGSHLQCTSYQVSFGHALKIGRGGFIEIERKSYFWKVENRCEFVKELANI